MKWESSLKKLLANASGEFGKEKTVSKEEVIKDFNYHEIKIIIVGVWKEASRITSLASDLLDRCQHIDIGTWTETELRDVINMGERALNIAIFIIF